jgi:hypothetical protein
MKIGKIYLSTAFSITTEFFVVLYKKNGHYSVLWNDKLIGIIGDYDMDVHDFKEID